MKRYLYVAAYDRHMRLWRSSDSVFSVAYGNPKHNGIILPKPKDSRKSLESAQPPGGADHNDWHFRQPGHL